MNKALNESLIWHKKMLAQKTIKSLEKNNIGGCYVETLKDARNKLVDLIPKGSKVGYGGSLTLDQIGIKKILREGDYHLLDREVPGITQDELYEVYRESLLADVFLMSTNAVTMEGQLVNMDGEGNRVSALIFGPKKVIILAGINKIVPDVEAAIYRIKNYITPIHARRRGKPLPCGKTGFCVNCHADVRSCSALTIIEHQKLKNKERITVIIVGEELGL